MNKAMLTIGVIILSVLSLLLINLISSASTGSELDYYLVKETAEAAMTDAVDTSYYVDNGVLRIDREKFMENFLLRFGSAVDNTRNYKISFYDINEVPPKVSVKVDSSTVLSFDGTNIDMTTAIDSILENKYKKDSVVTNGIKNGSNGTALDKNDD